MEKFLNDAKEINRVVDLPDRLIDWFFEWIERLRSVIWPPPEEHTLTARAYADDAEAFVDFRVDTTAARTPWEGRLPKGSYKLYFPDSYDEFVYKNHEVR